MSTMHERSGRGAGSRQRGAVLLLVTFSLIVFFGLAALVVDVGRMYIVKSQLQNAADSGALKGAKELLKQEEAGGTPILIGAGSVTELAIAGAKQNAQLLGTAALADPHILVDFSDQPYPSAWETGGACGGDPKRCRFVRVRTSAPNVASYLAGVIGITSNAANALAVAGQSVLNVTPLGVCAVIPSAGPTDNHASGNKEYGFIRGVAYNVPALNPLVLTSDPLWINPVDVPSGANDSHGCQPSHSSNSFNVPFVCGGSAIAPRPLPGYVFWNSGTQAGLDTALNTRFDVYQGLGNKCNATTAPPDTNIKEYLFNGGGSGNGSPPWMNPAPSGQTISLSRTTRTNLANGSLAWSTWRNSLKSAPAGWGVLWSYNAEVNYASATWPNPWTVYATNDWAQPPTPNTTPPLYMATPSGYPTTFPYLAGGAYSQSPVHPGRADRRLLNLVIIDCDAGTFAGPPCLELHALAIGKFFMQTKANLNGPTRKIEVEFAGLQKSAVAYPEIRLYR